MKAALRTRPIASACNAASSVRLRRPHAIRLISSTSSRDATPRGPAAPGPAPPPPQPSPPSAADSLARKRSQYELMKSRQSATTNTSKPGSLLQKRFWKNVSVKETPDGLQVHLDTRPVRTPTRTVLNIPHTKAPLTTAIALEWDLLVSAQQALKQHYIPLTSLTSRANDIAAGDAANDSKIRDSIVRMVMGYLSTDTLLCWAPPRSSHDAESKIESQTDAPTQRKSLREVQMETALPIISFLTTKVWPGIEVNPVLEENSIMPTPQPEQTTQVIRGWIAGLPAFELAALERGVLASKSLLIATRLLVEWSGEFKTLQEDAAQKFGIEEAAKACTLEVTWQTDMWGEVEDTHDVDKEDVRRQLGSVILLVQNGKSATA